MNCSRSLNPEPLQELAAILVDGRELLTVGLSRVTVRVKCNGSSLKSRLSPLEVIRPELRKGTVGSNLVR